MLKPGHCACLYKCNTSHLLSTVNVSWVNTDNDLFIIAKSCSVCFPSRSSYSLAGVSRSVTLVVAYIMTVTGLGWQEALAAVKVVRPCAGPNLGFQRQLQEFEKTEAEQVGGNKASILKMKHEKTGSIPLQFKLTSLLFYM